MTALADLGGWATVLRQLAEGNDIGANAAAAIFDEILTGTATHAQMAAFAMGMRAKGEHVDEVTSMASVMLQAAVPLDVPDGLDPVDTCGTGGTRQRQESCFNVGTLAAIVASAAGATVCKHGGPAATATSSSADCQSALGIVPDLGPTGVVRCLTDVGLGFVFSPRFHPASRHAATVRRELAFATFFNLLGPLCNPARVRRHLLGAMDVPRARLLAEVMSRRDRTLALIVHGHDGLDEMTTTTTSTVFEVVGGEVRETVIDPREFGLKLADPAELRGGSPADNARLAASMLGGEPGPHRDIVALNAGGALVAAGKARDLAHGVQLASSAIDSGRARATLERIAEVSQQARAEEATP